MKRDLHYSAVRIINQWDRESQAIQTQREEEKLAREEEDYHEYLWDKAINDFAWILTIVMVIISALSFAWSLF